MPTSIVLISSSAKTNRGHENPRSRTSSGLAARGVCRAVATRFIIRTRDNKSRITVYENPRAKHPTDEPSNPALAITAIQPTDPGKARLSHGTAFLGSAQCPPAQCPGPPQAHWRPLDTPTGHTTPPTGRATVRFPTDLACHGKAENEPTPRTYNCSYAPRSRLATAPGENPPAGGRRLCRARRP